MIKCNLTQAYKFLLMPESLHLKEPRNINSLGDFDNRK